MGSAAMTGSQWLRLVAVIALIAFIVFALRHGMQVKPDRDPKNSPASSL